MRRAFIGILAMVCGLFTGQAARACGPEVVIQFIDSSPDLFIIENRSLEAWTLLSLEFRAEHSAGRVVFDTDFGGAGAAEPQQFEIVDGEVGLMRAPLVADGAEELTLHFANFEAGRKFIFTIDLDDRLPMSDMGQAYVTGEEIAGAEVTGLFTHPKIGDGKARGSFGTDGKAHLRGATCA
ncbi:MAG: hypothetical protein COW30_18915 [Rhodospirillales bacterium CG15_BIG_FIL_POST_REV_8_21_14_020_66_15]|nr:MAG: hypothetical protein COW30_18915 [Rhodospirillales bacterium CG15_BIG_FIL_POST_REV_8_21_14_020_66_15]